MQIPVAVRQSLAMRDRKPKLGKPIEIWKYLNNSPN